MLECLFKVSLHLGEVGVSGVEGVDEGGVLEGEGAHGLVLADPASELDLARLEDIDWGVHVEGVLLHL